MTMRQRELIEAQAIALVADFVGDITGLKPPVERKLFPPYMRPALDRLVDGLLKITRASDAPKEG